MRKNIIPFKYRIRSRIYGYEYFEYSFLDSTLNEMKYGEHFSSESIFGKLEAGDRVYNKLLADGYIEKVGDILRITSEGLLFLGEGGYTSRYISSKRNTFSFFFSVIAILIATASFIISLLK